MARRQGHAARQGRAVSSPDAGQDRALAPDAQEPHPPRALQSSPLSREPRQPHPGRRLLRTRPDHPPRTRKDQTTDHRQPPLAASRPSRLTSKPEEPEPPFQKPAPCLKLSDDGHKRIDIRAPQDGVVHQLNVHTVGGVINPGEPLMLVVPKADSLTVEAKIAPQDIDQVRIGHKAVLRFSAFNQRTTPEINGEVTLVSADITQDQKTGTSFYTVRITPPAGELARLNGLKLVPGMPVESFIQTGDRTVISYLTKPLADQITKAWREK